MDRQARFTLRLILTLVIALLIAQPAMAQPVHAPTAFTIKVNTTNDSNTADNFISLREAILLVNGGTGGDGLRSGLGRALTANEAAQITGGVFPATATAATIVFTDLPGLSTIALTTGTGQPNESLPPIMTSGVTIDGRNAVGGKIIIDGSAAPASSDVLWLGFATSTVDAVQVSNISVSSVIVTGAQRYGIQLDPARASTVSQCVVTQSVSYGIFVQGKFGSADGNTINDCTVMNNLSLGIVINRPGAFNNIMSNNRVGTDATGTTAAPNTGAGIALFTGAHNNTISGNLISGNTLQGIFIDGTAASVTDNVIQGNKIGVAVDGVTALPNVQGIVFADGSLNNLVGGTAAGQANIIAHNTQSGIVAVGNNTRGNHFSGNSIFDNGILGIDLLDDKIQTPGVSGGGVGPNELALRPTLTQAQTFNQQAVLAGVANPNSTVEIFIADHATANGSGKTYCGSVTADAGGNFTLAGTLACLPGPGLIATSTLVDGSTSEFGPVAVPTPLKVLFLPYVNR